MKCHDCSFEYTGGNACPRCGYDASVDLIQCVHVENPHVLNKLEQESIALCKKAEAGEIPRSRIEEQWRITDQKAAKGDLDARHVIGRAALMQKKYDLAHKILAPLADTGHALAQLDLARIYDEGLDIERNVFDAIRLLRLAALRGNPMAIYQLAEKYGAGDGVLRHDVALANAVMEQLVTAYPNMFQRKQPTCGGCSCGKPLTNGEFAAQTASQMSKMLKYLVIAALIAFVAYVLFTEFAS